MATGTIIPMGVGGAKNVRSFPTRMDTNCFSGASPSGNADAVVTLALVAGKPYIYRGIYFAYDSTPAAGFIKVASGTSPTTQFQLPVTAAGPGFLPFPQGIAQAVAGEQLVITLTAGGGSVKGYVYVDAYLEDS